MSLGDELLNTVVEEGEASVSTVEPHITIGRDRVIHVPEQLRRLGVKKDHNIETVTFDCIRHWDGHDMSEMTVYIVYQTPDGIPELYPTPKPVVDETDDSIMHFDWTISRNVTSVPGQLKIQVCVKKTDGEGNEANHWNSEPNDECYISDGLDCDAEDTSSNKYPDLITDLIERMDKVENTADTAWKNGVEQTLESKLDEDDIPTIVEQVIAALPAAETASF